MDEKVLRQIIKEQIVDNIVFLPVHTIEKCEEYVNGAPFSVFDAKSKKDMGRIFFILIEPAYFEITGKKIPNIFSSLEEGE